MQQIKQNLYDEIQLIKKMIVNGEIDKNEGYMYIAYLVSLNSEDTTKTGACVVSRDDKVISYGYNAPLETYKNEIDYSQKLVSAADNPYGYKGGKGEVAKDNWLETKYPYVLHAERQAIYSAYQQGNLMDNATIYATLFPCNECALTILASGITKLYYHDDKYMDKPFSQAAINLFDGCSIPYEKIEFNDKYLAKKMGERFGVNNGK